MSLLFISSIIINRQLPDDEWYIYAAFTQPRGVRDRYW